MNTFSFTEGEASVVGQMPATLLDVLMEHRESSGKGLQTMTRVCLMGRLAAGTTGPSFSSWCEKALLPSGNSVTGLLVLLPEGWFQTIEGPAEDIPPFLQALRHCSLLRSTTVLACQEDVRTRYFPHWSSAQAVVVRSNYAEIDADGLPKLIADTVVAMLKIGKKLTADRTSPASAAKLVASWEKHFADFMPSNERLAQLHELEGLPSLAEFLDIFESPVDVVVQSEEIWPPERPVVY